MTDERDALIKKLDRWLTDMPECNFEAALSIIWKHLWRSRHREGTAQGQQSAQPVPPE